VGFVVLALAFLFKLALDRGWITPPLRMIIGLGVGTGMLGAGLMLEDSRRRYSQVLMGGAMGVFYLVGYAAYQWYALLSHTAAFSYMIAITALAFALSVRQNESTLATIGAVGGIATPFLLYTEQGSITGLIVYLSLLLAGAGAVQVWRGWRVLQLTLVAGGLLVLMIASTQGETADRWLIPLGAFVWWLVVGASPLLRRWYVLAWGNGGGGAPSAPSDDEEDQLDRVVVPLLGIFGSIVAVFVAADALGFGRVASGTLLLGLGAGFVVVAVACLPVRGAAAEIAAILIGVGTFVALPGPAAFAVLTVGAAVMHAVATRHAVPTLYLLGHGLSGFLAAWLVIGALGRLDTNPLDSWALSTLGSIAFVLAVTSVTVDRSVRAYYLLAGYGAVLYWAAVELSPLSNGPALVSIMWGVLGVGILIVGWRRASRELQRVGLGTLALTAAKLLLFDLVQLDVVWRILVFMGFGATFLALGYLINRNPAAAHGERL
jgi:uncharacterized membrane protein